MKVTVVIPTIQKTLPYLELCVKSLRATTPDWDIIVVSNKGGYSYPIDLPVRRYHIGRQGQCHAVNVGVKLADPDTDYIMVSNDDMYYAPGWNDNLPVIDSMWDLCFSPNLIEPTDNAGSAPPFNKLDGGLTLDEFKQGVIDQYVADRVKAVDVKDSKEDGFNFPVFIKKEVWDVIEGYDNNYDPWGSNSDTDLQTKIELAGIKPKRYRDMLVYHFGSKSGTFDPDKQSYWQKNWDYYQNKWGFNRDELGSDTWYCRDMLPKDESRIKFKPDWKGKYA